MLVTVSGLVTGVQDKSSANGKLYRNVVLLPDGETYPVRLSAEVAAWPADAEVPVQGSFVSYTVKVFANLGRDGKAYLSGAIRGAA